MSLKLSQVDGCLALDNALVVRSGSPPRGKAGKASHRSFNEGERAPRRVTGEWLNCSPLCQLSQDFASTPDPALTGL